MIGRPQCPATNGCARNGVIEPAVASVVVAALAGLTGALLAFNRGIGPLPPAVVALAGLVTHRRWLWLAGITLTGLVLFSYGFNNVPVRIAGVAVPAVDLAIPLVAAMAYSVWCPVAGTNRPLAWSVALLWAVVAVRLVIDFPHQGKLAVRDSLFAAELLSLPVGAAIARSVGYDRAVRLISRLFTVSLLWLALFPFRDTIAALGPDVGIQKRVPLLSMTSAGWVAAAAVIWFVLHRSRGASLLVWLGVLVVLFYQARGLYLGLPAGLVLAGVVRRWGQPSYGGALGAVARGAAALGLGVATLVLLPPLPGRILPAQPHVVGEQLATLVGREGPGAGSLMARETWWSEVWGASLSSPTTVIFGVGLGRDLTGGFKGPDGSEVRKPHNDFLEVYARFGLLGLGAWCWLLGSAIARLVRSARKGCSIAGWALAVQPVALAVALTQPFFAFAYGGAVYWAVVGLGLGCPCLDRGQFQERVPTFSRRVQEAAGLA